MKNSTQFLPLVNLHNASIERALRNGSLKLQSGQPVICGKGSPVSVFDCVNGNHIKVFHGATYQQALNRYRASKESDRAFEAFELGYITRQDLSDVLNGQSTIQYLRSNKAFAAFKASL